MPDILTAFLTTLPGTLEQGLIYAVLALGVMVTYTILDFPDLSVDGSFPLGGAVSTALLLRGAPPLAALGAALLSGAAAGLMTGLIHVKLKIRDLFSGIITMTALYSVNLRIAGGSSLLSIPRGTPTLFRHNPLAAFLPERAAVLLIALFIVLLMKVLLDLFLKTRAGFLLRAAGDNEAVVTALARDRGNVRILGLMIANALVALSGAVVCQQQRLFEVSMGTGAIVMGLASVIIGTNLFRRLEWVRGTSAVIAGALLYKLCVAFALACGLKPGDLRLITAALFLGILSTGLLKKRSRSHA